MTGAGTVLVTGAAGFYGLAITRALMLADIPVIATDRVGVEAFAPRRGGDRSLLSYVQRDITTQRLGDLIAEVSTVVHAAALTPGQDQPGEGLDALLAVNLAPIPAILEDIRQSPHCRRLVFVSSAGVYEQTADRILSEDQAGGGQSLYGSAKLAAELVVSRYATICDVQFCCLRPTSLFGPGEAPRPSRPRVTAFRQLMDAAADNAAVQIENPDVRADWLHVDDAAAAVVELLRAPELPGGALNVSSGRSTSLGTIARELTRTVGLQVHTRAERIISGGVDRPARVPNDRLRAAVAWTPQLSFADAARTILTEAL